MPTTKRRINITVDDDTYRVLVKLAKREDRSLAEASLRLLRKALALREDRYFSIEADGRLDAEEKRVSHAKAWK